MKNLILIFFLIYSMSVHSQMNQLSLGVGSIGLGYFSFSETLPNFELNYNFSYSHFSASLSEGIAPLNNEQVKSFSNTQLLVGFQTNPEKKLVMRLGTGVRYCIFDLNNEILFNTYTILKTQMNFANRCSFSYKLSTKSSLGLSINLSFIKQREQRGVSGGKYTESNPDIGLLLSYIFTINEKH